MDKPISVGDLVQVILPAACGCTTALGITRAVLSLTPAQGRCATCSTLLDNNITAKLDGHAPWSNWHIPLWRLKRIPPANELEGVRDASGLDERPKVPA